MNEKEKCNQFDLTDFQSREDFKMEVEKIKQLLSLLSEIGMSRTEFLIEFNDYIKNIDGSDVTFEEWLINVNIMSRELQSITDDLINGFRNDNF